MTAPTLAPRGFWISAILLAFFLAASSTPTTHYSRYAALWHFSPTTLTVVFSVYAVALLTTLLLFGSLSDAIGRKPVITTALVLLGVSQVLFLLASGVGWLIAARIVQGVATGLATAAIPAALLDQQPTHRPGLAGQLAASASTAGLAIGALLSAGLAEYAPAPTQLGYVALLAVGLALGIVAHWFTDDAISARRRPSLRIQVGVAPALRPAFLGTMPCLISTWAISGFYLSLGPALARDIAGNDDVLLGGVAVATLTGFGALAAIAAHRLRSRHAMLGGCVVLIAGSALTSVAIATASAPTFVASTAIAGLGFGAAYLGAYRSLIDLAEPTQRSALVAAIFTVAYLAMAVPAIIAGLFTTHVGLRATAIGFSVTVAALAVVSVIATILTTHQPTSAVIDDTASPSPRPHP